MLNKLNLTILFYTISEILMMNCTFDMLSSMSPKVGKKTRKLYNKSPTKLALKRNIRRYSYLDISSPKTNAMLLDKASTESSSVHTDTVTITSEDEENVQCERHTLSFKTKKLHKSKNDAVRDWLLGVKRKPNFEYEDELSSICGELKTKPDTNRAFSSTQKHQSTFESNTKREEILQDEIEDSFEANKYTGAPENILDQLYGAEWRKKQELILTPVAKKVENKRIVPKTDVKAKSKSVFESPWMKKLKTLCDPESDDSFSLRLSFNEDVQSNKDEDSDKENFDFLINDNLSFEERIRKKLSGDCLTSTTQPLTNKPQKDIKNKLDLSDHFNQSLTLDEPKPTILKDVKKNVLKKPNDNTPIKIKSKIPIKYNKLDIYSSKKNEESKLYSFLQSLSGDIPLTNCDASARIFRNSFNQYKEELIRKLFKLFNERVFNNVLPEDLPIEWNSRMRGTAGFCHCKKITKRNGNIERKVKIVLASKILDCASRLRDTFIHELCHAATWIVNEVSDGHGPYWKAWARKAMEVFPELPPIKRCHDYVINTKYTYKCTGCGYSFGRHTRSINIERKRCGHCYGTLEIIINKVNAKGETKKVPATPKKQPTAFALFVKENYGLYRSPQVNHAQVMQTLSIKYNETKAKD